MLNGSHSLTAVARDTSGNTRTSTAVSVTAANPVVPARPPRRVRARRDVRHVRGRLVRRDARTARTVGTTWTAGTFGNAAAFDGISDRIDLPALGTFYKTGFTLEAWVQEVLGEEGRRRARQLVGCTVGRADDLGRPHGRPLLPDARQRQPRRTISTRAARRPSASGSTSPRPTTARPRASTSTASRWRARALRRQRRQHEHLAPRRLRDDAVRLLRRPARQRPHLRPRPRRRPRSPSTWRPGSSRRRRPPS